MSVHSFVFARLLEHLHWSQKLQLCGMLVPSAAFPRQCLQRFGQIVCVGGRLATWIRV